MFSDVFANEPGYGDAYYTYETHFRWGREQLGVITNGHISGATRDAGNTGNTSSLRPGLLLGRIAASGLLKEYSPTATDGSNYVEAILLAPMRTTTFYDGSNVAKLWGVLVGGPVKSAKLIGLDHVARSQMRGRFLLDDDFPNTRGYTPWHRETAKAASYTVVAADAGTLFVATAAATFTLPTKAAGLGPFWFLNAADTDMVIASAGSADDIVTDGDAAADSITYSTASHKIGALLMVWCNAAGTKWYTAAMSLNAQTIA